jgi:hypothetical protein
MAGALTDVEFANRALARIGLAPVNSFDEDDDDYEAQVGRLYASVTEALLSWSDWSFNKKAVQLSRLTNPGPIPAQWSYAHQLPPDRLGGLQSLFPGTSETSFAEFEISGDVVWSNETTLTAVYRFKNDPGQWPGYFRRVCETALASQFAESIAENHTKAERLQVQAFGSSSEAGHGGEMAMAELMDAHGRPGDTFDPGGDPLTHARY